MPVLASYTLGTGPRPTILLHGFLGSGKNLRTLAQRWSQADPTRTFLVPDLPAHGSSPPPAGEINLGAPPAREINLGAPVAREINLGDLAAPVLETAVARGMAGVTMVGHSVGGRVALAALRDSPRLVERVVLLDIAPGPIDDARSESRRVLDLLLGAPAEAADRRELRQFFVDEGMSGALADWLMMNVMREGDRYRWRFDRRLLDKLHTAVSGEDLWGVIEVASGRVSCARGGRSRYVSEEDVRRMESLGCRVHTIPDAGHYVHVDALDALVAWLSQL